MKITTLLISLFPLYLFPQNLSNLIDFERLKQLSAEPRHYICYKTNEKITIDGKMSEESWQKAQWTEDFVDIEGDLQPQPLQTTKVKMLWDNDCLYIAAKIDEEQIWAYMNKHDQVVFYDNDFEVFIDPDNDARNYFEYEMNARNTIFDLFLPHPYRHSSFALHNWDFKGVRSAVYIDGTINDGKDKDKYWSVEIAIPFQSLSFGLADGRPDIKTPWRINFSRVEWKSNWNGKQYTRLTDANNKLLPEYNWVWSPVGAISMHMPERYGYLKFSSYAIGEQLEEFRVSVNEKYKTILWNLFYLEENYFEKYKKYTDDGNSIRKIVEKLVDVQDYQLDIKITEIGYEAKLENKNIKMYITNEGVIVCKSVNQ